MFVRLLVVFHDDRSRNLGSNFEKTKTLLNQQQRERDVRNGEIYWSDDDAFDTFVKKGSNDY